MDSQTAGCAGIPRPGWLESIRAVFGIDLRALAALRIGTGLLILSDLFERAQDVQAFYSDEGTMPRTLLIERVSASPWCVSFHLLSGQPAVQWFLLLIAAAFAIALILGFHTKAATVVSWILLVSLQYRNPIILQGGDVLLRLLLFWGMFLPWEERYSTGSKARIPISAAGPFLSVATLALLLQICFVYVFAARLKSDPAWTRDFTAVYDAFSLDHFVKPLGKLLLPYHRTLRAVTALSYWIEAIGAVVALFSSFIGWRLRTAMVFLFMGFHAGMAACLELGLFPAICWVAWLVFLPPPFWNWCERRLSPLFSSIRCGADFVSDILRSSAFGSMAGSPPPSTYRARRLEYPAAANTFQAAGIRGNSFLDWPIEVVCAARAASRSESSGSIRFSHTIKVSEPKATLGTCGTQASPDEGAGGDRIVPPEPSASSVPNLSLTPAELNHPGATSHCLGEVVRRRCVNLLAAFFLLYVFLWNLRSTDFTRFARFLPPSTDAIAWLSGTAQVWDMFAPRPLMEGGWFVMPAHLADGKVVDIFRGGAPVSWEKPALVSRMYPNDRWRKYMVLIAAASNAPLRPALAAYLYRHWNSSHPSQMRIVSLEIVLMEQDTLPEKGHSAPRPIQLWSGNWNP
jgi:hypothetical protein